MRSYLTNRRMLIIIAGLLVGALLFGVIRIAVLLFIMHLLGSCV